MIKTAQQLNSIEINNQEPLLGLAPLMRAAYSGTDLTPLATVLLDRATRNPSDCNALMDLAIVLQLRGDPTTALALQHQALVQQQLYSLPATRGQTAIKLLAIMAPGALIANTPLEFLVEDSDIEVQMLYVSPELPLPASLPEHDVAFVLISELDANMPILQRIDNLTEFWPRPVINDPARIPSVCRNTASTLLQSVPGVTIEQNHRLDRLTLKQVGQGELALNTIIEEGTYPIIVRPVDSHAGRGLVKIDQHAALLDYLQTISDAEYYISRFVDYSENDGMYRKARIVVIDGQPFAVHMAVSENWMIHYLNAGMTESAEKRAEEERFMLRFKTDFAVRHARAIQGITEQLGLDYYAIDCAETSSGELLVFEVGNAMVVHTMDPVDIFPYKKPQMQLIFDAFRTMLVNRIERNMPWEMALNKGIAADTAASRTSLS